MRIVKRSVIAISSFFLLLFALSQNAVAFENPSQYYDWNTYYENPQVLGTVTAQEPESTPEGQQETPPTGTPEAEPVNDYHDYQQYDGYFLGIGANLAPDSPFYFFKTVQETVAITFAFDSQAREQLRLEFAGERMSEMEQMADEGKTTALNSLAQSYDNLMDTISQNLESLHGQNQDVTELLVQTDEEAAKHLLVLEEVHLQVPPEAEDGLKTAIEASEHTVDTIADLADRPAVPPEVVDRLQALKAQGLLTEEEVAKLIAVQTRREARTEFQKLAEAGILPEGDYVKLSEAPRAYFPQGFAQIVEYRKFRELERLDRKKPDEETIRKIQEFAQDYEPGKIVPPDLRPWWGPMVRYEELQATFRADLLDDKLFQYRPDRRQQFQEIVARLQPTQQDIDYVNNLIEADPGILNDPHYARIKALADRYGIADQNQRTPTGQVCSSDTHWVTVPFMPGGGYCVPNLVYSAEEIPGGETPCAPGYHRNQPGGVCYPDNPNGPGVGFVSAPGSCPSGYSWKSVEGSAGGRGGYCSPDVPTAGGGPYPGPNYALSYCPQGQVMREGKCQKYNPPPKEGCQDNSFWNGEKCIAYKNCGPGKYQAHNGECRSTTDPEGGKIRTCAPPSNVAEVCQFGCWDNVACGCTSCTLPVTPIPGDGGKPDYAAMKSQCESQGGYWTPGNYCRRGGDTYVTYQTPPPYASPASDGGSGGTGGGTSGGSGGGGTGVGDKCGPGYYWTGSYCAPSSGSGGGGYQYPTPYSGGSGGGGYAYPSPYSGGSGGSSGSSGGGYAYPSPYSGGSGSSGSGGSGSSGSGSYGTPSYQTPSGSYTTPSYGTPSQSYTTPSYNTPPSYGTPEYSTPPPYGTPEYSSPPPYGTPEYSSPPPYGTPEYSTPPPP